MPTAAAMNLFTRSIFGCLSSKLLTRRLVAPARRIFSFNHPRTYACGCVFDGYGKETSLNLLRLSLSLSINKPSLRFSGLPILPGKSPPTIPIDDGKTPPIRCGYTSPIKHGDVKSFDFPFYTSVVIRNMQGQYPYSSEPIQRPEKLSGDTIRDGSDGSVFRGTAWCTRKMRRASHLRSSITVHRVTPGGF